MNIKYMYQPLLKIIENCIKLRYRCNGFFSRLKRARQQYTKIIQFSNFAVSNSIRMFGQCPEIWNHFSIFLVQAESYKRVFAFLFDTLPVSQDNFEFKIFNIQHLFCHEDITI